MGRYSFPSNSQTPLRRGIQDLVFAGVMSHMLWLGGPGLPKGLKEEGLSLSEGRPVAAARSEIHNQGSIPLSSSDRFWYFMAHLVNCVMQRSATWLCGGKVHQEKGERDRELCSMPLGFCLSEGVEFPFLGRTEGDYLGRSLDTTCGEGGVAAGLGRPEVAQNGGEKRGSEVPGIWIQILTWPPHSCVDKSLHLSGLPFPLPLNESDDLRLLVWVRASNESPSGMWWKVFSSCCYS